MKINIRSFRVKITLILVLCMFFAAALSDFLIYRFTLKSQFQQLRDKLMIIAQTAALTVDGELLLEVPLSAEGMKTTQYKVIAEKLRKIKEVNPSLKYIYTLAKTQTEGILEFIVDIEVAAVGKKKDFTAYPGYRYDARSFPEMLEAFSGPSADKKLAVDEWGVTLSGYAPIRDKDGGAIAILGVDITASDVYTMQKEVHARAILILALSIILALALGVLISGRITRPVKKLVEGTRRIAAGDLQYQVEVGGNDEIGQLARSFNQMGISLYEARRNLHSYFYRIMQSLVRIMEARDHYTRGHSERVAEYAVKVAVKMGFPKDKIRLLREVALLHDIGKLGIQESILNKNGGLSKEERDLIQRHPVIGEDILRPVLLDEEMLKMIRGHHERFDGKGYPDGLSGDNINILAKIISVADTYDAMTSSRAYRSAMNKEKAIEELSRNSGTQFDPKVVDVFIKAIEGA